MRVDSSIGREVEVVVGRVVGEDVTFPALHPQQCHKIFISREDDLVSI